MSVVRQGEVWTEPTPLDLVEVANREHALAREAGGQFLYHALRAGDALRSAKASLKHGDWLLWLEANFAGSEETARRYIRLAKHRSHVTDLDEPSLRKALTALAGPSGGKRGDAGSVVTIEDQLIIEQVRGGQLTVVNLHRHGAAVEVLAAEDRYVRIDRQTDWGNPFEMPDDGDRATVIENYRRHYLPHKPSLTARLSELRGKALGCWCAPERCHGDVLREALT